MRKSLKRWEVKTIVDTARGINPCPKAQKFIDELDQEYAEKPQKRARKQKKGFLDWLLGED